MSSFTMMLTWGAYWTCGALWQKLKCEGNHLNDTETLSTFDVSEVLFILQGSSGTDRAEKSTRPTFEFSTHLVCCYNHAQFDIEVFIFDHDRPRVDPAPPLCEIGPGCDDGKNNYAQAAEELPIAHCATVGGLSF